MISWREVGERRGAEEGKIKVKREGGERRIREEGEGRIADRGGDEEKGCLREEDGG